MGVDPLTAAQAAALDSPGPLVAVAAGAGSGKTTLLVEAVWRDVEVHGVPIERILVATYNRAAAAHLATRLAQRFADRAQGRPPGRAGLDLSAARVGTFHSLCARVVRDHPFAAGVDPAFTELEGPDALALAQAALDDAIEATDHPGLLDLLAQAWSAQPVRDAALAAHERLRAAGHVCPRIVVPEVSPVAQRLRVRVDELADALARHADVKPEHQDSIVRARAMATTGELPEKVVRATTACKKTVKPLCEEFNAAARELFDAIADELARDQLAGFAELIDGFAAGYAERKGQLGALDHEDLLLAARRVLRAGVSYDLAVAYVDEYQDANPVQDEIVRLLGAQRTVVVGDACQAIYGFRHADPALLQARAEISDRHELRHNFRSQRPLLEVMNAWLAQALAAEPAFAPLEAAADSPRPGPALSLPPAELVTVQRADGSKATRAEARADEVRVVADEVLALRRRGFEHREIAVLFRALTQVEGFEAALRARGIPTLLVAGRGFFAHQQVADALALLALVENPHDEPALVRVLASPYLAASDSALVALRVAAGERGALWPALPGVAPLAPLADRVAELRAARRAAGLAGLVDRVVSADGYELAALGSEGGARRHANLRKLVRLAAGFAAVRGDDLRGFLSWVERLAEEANQDPGEAALVDPGLDAVRLSTVHGVKGQGFPAVVLADATHAPGGQDPIVLVETDGRAGMRLMRHGETKNHETLGYTDLKARLRAAVDAEERRIAYVALTRAERHLVVVGQASTDRRTAYGILAVAPSAPRRTVTVAPSAPEPVLAPPAPPAVTPAQAPTPPPTLPLGPPPLPAAGRRLSFTALAAHARCSLRFLLEHEWGLRGPSRDEIAVPGAPGAPALAAGAWAPEALGSLVHARLEGHAWGGVPPPAGWATDDAAALGWQPSPAQAARAEALLAALLASPLAARIPAGARAERPFALALDGALVAGAVDLWAQRPDGTALLCDWKTHRLDAVRTPATLMGDYELQRALYGLAALRAGHPAAELAWVFLEAPQHPQVRHVTQADRPALEAELRDALAALATPPRPVATTPQPVCAGCPGLRAVCPVAGVIAGAVSPPGAAPAPTGSARGGWRAAAFAAPR